MTDPNVLRILEPYIDLEDFRDHDGDPPLRPEMLWGLFRSYTENYLVAGTQLRPDIPAGAPDDGVSAFEALTAARCLAEQIQRTAHGWIITEARKEGRSWSDIGRALGMTKQAAWELYQKHAASLDGSPWPKLRDEARAAAGTSPDD